jgi:hypothetical protein
LASVLRPRLISEISLTRLSPAAPDPLQQLQIVDHDQADVVLRFSRRARVRSAAMVSAGVSSI